MEKKSSVKEIVVKYSILMVLIGIILVFVQNLFKADIVHVPIGYTSAGEGITNLVTAKSMLDNGWIYSNSYIGAPNGLQNYDATTMELLLSAIEQVCLSITGNWVLGYNLFYLSAYFFIGIWSGNSGAHNSGNIRSESDSFCKLLCGCI